MTVVSAIVRDGNVSAIVRDENVSAIVRDWNMSATVPSLESITERRLALGRRHMYSKGHNTTGVRVAPDTSAWRASKYKVPRSHSVSYTHLTLPTKVNV